MSHRRPTDPAELARLLVSAAEHLTDPGAPRLPVSVGLPVRGGRLALGRLRPLYVRGCSLLVALDRLEPARKLAEALRRRLMELGDSPMSSTSEALGTLFSEAEHRRLARLAREEQRTDVATSDRTVTAPSGWP